MRTSENNLYCKALLKFANSVAVGIFIFYGFSLETLCCQICRLQQICVTTMATTVQKALQNGKVPLVQCLGDTHFILK